jgi:hypothetical protein
MKEASNEARRWFLQAKDDLKFVSPRLFSK